ncbi:MAG: magnesium/cobalt transporter CorA [Candidatus Krumholzibacteria bacterium]|nr:magnesium/cobalt transporter CorA [Candidatus Krumholzibacteria bacterium]MDH4335791.1 magnesium/cobalt transporter CorA [Candidatus Krumholzibacteria bacterium]MDH5269317.1 magnesium/cobalt transporter CorA [Candidatus Krumholzibacteria bacterium]
MNKAAIFRKRHPPAGSRPGTLVAPEGSPPPKIRVMRYDPAGVEEFDITDPEQLRDVASPGHVAWIDVQGLGDVARLRQVGAIFDVHLLALEDVVNAPQRPKAEEFEKQLLLIARMATIKSETLIEVEQVAVLLGDNYVISVQETYGDCLDPVRVRIREGLGRMRKSGPDYLAYAIIDTIIDGYYPVIDRLSTRIMRIEDLVLTRPTPATLNRLNRVKTDLVVMRRGVWPQQETVGRLLRDPSRFISESVKPYLRDTYDHCSQLVDVVDSHRELVNGLMNTYLSVTSNRTNEVMKVLTIMASIFIPLTFIAGIYGMNFQDMPELTKKWAYPAVLGVMTATGIGMLLFFRHRGWLGGDGADDEMDEE